MSHLKPIKLACVAVAAALALLTSGCSGVNSGVGVSPASFLLPGLLMHDPEPTTPFPTTLSETNMVVVAQTR
jgi:hypothetical protein